MSFFKDLKDKVNEKLFIRDEEYDEDEEITEDVQLSDEEESAYYDDGMSPPPYNSYSYSPTGGLHAPEYNYSKSSYVPPAPEFNFAKSTKTAPVPEYKAPAQEKKSANIYNMNSVRAFNKFKLNSITLNDIYAAKEVALLMMEKDAILIVNFSPLTDDQKLRAMDFLDGARCVTNAIFARLNENIIVFVPENVELCGDFQSQVDLESIR